MSDSPGGAAGSEPVESESDGADDEAGRANANVARMLGSILAGSLLAAAGAWAAVAFGPLSADPVVSVGLGAAVGGGLGAVASLLTGPAPATDGVETISVSMDAQPDDEAETVESTVPSRPSSETDLFRAHPDPVLYFEGEGADVRVGDANEAFEATFGAAAEMLAGTPLDEAAMATEHVGLASRVASGEAVAETVTCETVTGTDRFQLRTVPTGASTGYLLYTPVESTAAGSTESDRVEELASVLNHELKNPLDSARARIEVARDTGEDEHFETAIRNLDRMRRIVEDLTTLAREGVLVEDRQGVDLDATVETAWRRVDAPEGALAVEGGLGTLSADGGAVERLFENLFRNAVEHGGEDVSVRVGPLAEGNGFYVADDGPGIPESEREDVFEAGYTTDPDGTGLGLRIVQRVATAHGWTVRVTESEQGGARFVVSDVDALA